MYLNMPKRINTGVSKQQNTVAALNLFIFLTGRLAKSFHCHLAKASGNISMTHKTRPLRPWRASIGRTDKRS